MGDCIVSGVYGVSNGWEDGFARHRLELSAPLVATA